ncbi:unnamed protein product [Pleuronectes platessa]|uniref:Uncharacterized protein n=1 Tax=Pleuronectes platessa TaxID=8262 RepID=A0A9N7Z634_PLEPL|nr:unnamed protein product [Pleuronectes platessa]
MTPLTLSKGRSFWTHNNPANGRSLSVGSARLVKVLEWLSEWRSDNSVGGVGGYSELFLLCATSTSTTSTPLQRPNKAQTTAITL